MKKVSQLTQNPRNPRRITDEKSEMLKKSMDRFGDLSGILFNIKTELLVGGHQRQKILPEDASIVLLKHYDPPTRTGTVSEGYVLVNGERFAYREVDWDQTTEKAAMLAANKGAGEWDYPMLTDILMGLDTINFDLDLTMFDSEERDRLLGGWDQGSEQVDEIEENLDGIKETIKVKCPAEIKDEVLIYLKSKFLEVSFEGVEVV